jgi:monoterpene epsilon-lactone hydrolase
MTFKSLTRNGRGILVPLFGVLGLSALIVLSVAAQPPATQQQPRVVVDDDGTVHIPAQAVPMSAYLSPEGKAYMTQHLKYMLDPSQSVQVNGIPRYMVSYLERQRVLYPSDREDT